LILTFLALVLNTHQFSIFSCPHQHIQIPLFTFQKLCELGLMKIPDFVLDARWSYSLNQQKIVFIKQDIKTTTFQHFGQNGGDKNH
jgi:hypothetical protein